jgi:hypothetical protein
MKWLDNFPPERATAHPEYTPDFLDPPGQKHTETPTPQITCKDSIFQMVVHYRLFIAVPIGVVRLEPNPLITDLTGSLRGNLSGLRGIEK